MKIQGRVRVWFRWLLVSAGLAGLSAFAPVPAEAHGPSYRGAVHSRPAFSPVRHGGHWRPRVGVYIGAPVIAAPIWYHGYYGPSYYYSPPPAYYSTPQYEYIERDAPAAQPQQTWWYYCNEAQAYYPYVKECAGGWQRVAPQPPAQR